MAARVERWRRVSTVVATVLWFVLAFAGKPLWDEHSPTGMALFATGCLLTGLGCLGRAWCLVTISGRKNQELVTDGPYSLCRNPLYLFSLLAVFGMGLGSATFTIPCLAALGFAAYYPAVIQAEERRLIAAHGDAFAAYRQTTHALWPRFAGYWEAPEHTTNSRALRTGLFDMMWFFAVFAGMHLTAELHAANRLPVWFKLP